MNMPLKLIKIGNSTGVILPKEVLAGMRVAQGDQIFLGQAPGGYMIRPTDHDFTETMAAAETIMREDRDILAVLAK